MLPIVEKIDMEEAPHFVRVPNLGSCDPRICEDKDKHPSRVAAASWLPFPPRDSRKTRHGRSGIIASPAQALGITDVMAALLARYNSPVRAKQLSQYRVSLPVLYQAVDIQAEHPGVA